MKVERQKKAWEAAKHESAAKQDHSIYYLISVSPIQRTYINCFSFRNAADLAHLYDLHSVRN